MKIRKIMSLLAGSGALCFGLGSPTLSNAEQVSPLPNLQTIGCPPGFVCKRNVLLIIADDLGPDQLPRYVDYYKGTARTDDDITVKKSATNPWTATPAIDRLGSAGVTFLNAWSCPSCSATRAGIFTGRYSFRTGVYNPVKSADPDAPPLTSGTWTIANVLHAAGYQSGLFGKWHLGEESGNQPLDFGWDHFAGSLRGELENYYVWSKTTDTTTSTRRAYATYENVDDALDWITPLNDPWMATIAFNAPHSPWHVPASGCPYTESRTGATVSEQQKADYRMMVECMDHKIADLLNNIPAAKLENTTIIFMGDNGTPEGISDHFPKDHNKSSLYEGGVNVPLIIADGYSYLHGEESPSTKGIGRVVSPGRFETNLVQTLDLFATVATMARGDKTCGVDSVSMLPYLASASASAQRRVIFAETKDSAAAPWNVTVRGDEYKLKVTGYGTASPSYELYNLSNDRWEKATDLLTAGGTSDIERLLKFYFLQRLADVLAVPSLCTP